MDNYKTFFNKIFWVIAPLLWGIFSKFVWQASFIPSAPLKILVLALVASTIIIVVFGKALNNALKYKLYFFGYPIVIPPWWAFLLLLFLGIVVCFTPLYHYLLISSMAQTIFLYPIIEEFITRSVFVKYKMNLFQFLCLNILSSLSFTFMHCFYGEGFIEALTIGHFGFSFAFSIIVYKTQRIELTILLHMLSNVCLYTLPTIIFKTPPPSLVSGISHMIFIILFYLCLAGYAYSTYNKSEKIDELKKKI